MNTAPRPTLLADANLFSISPDLVDEGERIGFLHGDKAAALGRMMAVDGQRDPIKVVAQPRNKAKPWRLVTGMHRLVGARLEGFEVWAIEVKGKAEELADLEASENLHRRPLPPLERAKFVAALCDAARARIAREHGNLRQEQLAIKARWARVKSGEVRTDQALQEEANDTAAKIAAVYGWAASAADAFGMSIRSIHNALELHRFLVAPFPPELVRALADHPVVGENASQLQLIAKIRDDDTRRSAIELLLADPEMSAEAAVEQVGLRKAKHPVDRPRHTKFYAQVMDGFSRLSIAHKREFVDAHLLTLLSTPDLVRRAHEQLSARLREISDA